MIEYSKEIIELIAHQTKVVIIGPARSGKTTFANKLKQNPLFKDFVFYHTDMYGTKYGHVPGLYVLIEHLQKFKPPKWIIEGVMGVRFLRKIEQKDYTSLIPDRIVTMRTNRPRDPKHNFLNRGLKTIWEDYKKIRQSVIPLIEVWT